MFEPLRESATIHWCGGGRIQRWG